MRRRFRYAAALLAVLVAAVAYFVGGESRAEGQKPVKAISMHADGGIGAPPTVEELWSMTPLIVHAQIQNGRPADTPLNAPRRPTETVFIQTAYALRIVEVFKDTSGITRLGKSLEVRQIGGDRDRGEYIESVTDPTFSRLRVGERYLLFLKPSRLDDGTFVTATDTADGAFHLADDGTVRPRGNSEVSTYLAKYSREDLLNKLRTLAETRR